MIHRGIDRGTSYRPLSTHRRKGLDYRLTLHNTTLGTVKSRQPRPVGGETERTVKHPGMGGRGNSRQFCDL